MCASFRLALCPPRTPSFLASIKHCSHALQPLLSPALHPPAKDFALHSSYIWSSPAPNCVGSCCTRCRSMSFLLFLISGGTGAGESTFRRRIDLQLPPTASNPPTDPQQLPPAAATTRYDRLRQITTAVANTALAPFQTAGRTASVETTCAATTVASAAATAATDAARTHGITISDDHLGLIVAAATAAPTAAVLARVRRQHDSAYRQQHDSPSPVDFAHGQ